MLVKYSMSRQKKLFIIIPLVIAFFLAAYAKHRFIDSQIKPCGELDNKEADETSGIAASGIIPDTYYIQNDSGDTSRFFAINPQGKVLRTIYYGWPKNTTIAEHDCEDIACGPGPVKGKSYIYIADIGDNKAERPFVRVYRIADNERFGDSGADLHTGAVPLYLKYPDGPRDAEALMIDPVEKLLYIVSKRYDKVGIYTAPLSQQKGDTVTLTKRGMLFFKGIKPFKWVTAADISADGSKILLKTYEKVYYWQREPDQPAWKAMLKHPTELPYLQEKLGEAIGFTRSGKGYFTISEGVYAPLYYYPLP